MAPTTSSDERTTRSRGTTPTQCAQQHNTGRIRAMHARATHRHSACTHRTCATWQTRHSLASNHHHNNNRIASHTQTTSIMKPLIRPHL